MKQFATYKCIECNYKTTYQLKKTIHEKATGHKMVMIGHIATTGRNEKKIRYTA